MISFYFALLLSAVPDSVFENQTAWQPNEVDGALTVEQRPIEGSAFNEYRISLVTEVPVQTLCTAVFEWGTKGKEGPGIKQKKLLKDGADERVVYLQIEQPLIAMRDYAMTVRRDQVGEGSCRIRFKTTNEAAPATPKDFVRMELVWGGWLFEPASEGKTKVTHWLFADPGGSVPTFLVHGGQKKSAKASVVSAIEKAKAQK